MEGSLTVGESGWLGMVVRTSTSASAASPPLYRSPLPPSQAYPLSFPLLLRPEKSPDGRLKMHKNKDNDRGNYMKINDFL